LQLFSVCLEFISMSVCCVCDQKKTRKRVQSTGRTQARRIVFKIGLRDRNERNSQDGRSGYLWNSYHRLLLYSIIMVEGIKFYFPSLFYLSIYISILPFILMWTLVLWLKTTKKKEREANKKVRTYVQHTAGEFWVWLYEPTFEYI
jgi:hypothetical protein